MAALLDALRALGSAKVLDVLSATVVRRNPTISAPARTVQRVPAEERAEYLAGLGVEDGSKTGAATLIKEAYTLLGLRSYLTTGEKETRAWTIRAGDKAPVAAGVIHSDFEKGFIRAETLAYADLIQCGSWHAAKEKGLVRTEGKDYVVKDADIMHFLFNV